MFGPCHIQSRAIITRLNITKYCIYHCRKWGRISMTGWTKAALWEVFPANCGENWPRYNGSLCTGLLTYTGWWIVLTCVNMTVDVGFRGCNAAETYLTLFWQWFQYRCSEYNSRTYTHKYVILLNTDWKMDQFSWTATLNLVRIDSILPWTPSGTKLLRKVKVHLNAAHQQKEILAECICHCIHPYV